jgi:hypothetical protein
LLDADSAAPARVRALRARPASGGRCHRAAGRVARHYRHLVRLGGRQGAVKHRRGQPARTQPAERPASSLTILGKSWYHHVSLLGRVIELRDDPELADLDRLSRRYFGKRYPNRELRCISAVMEVERWHSFGDPAGQR